MVKKYLNIDPSDLTQEQYDCLEAAYENLREIQTIWHKYQHVFFWKAPMDVVSRERIHRDHRHYVEVSIPFKKIHLIFSLRLTVEKSFIRKKQTVHLNGVKKTMRYVNRLLEELMGGLIEYRSEEFNRMFDGVHLGRQGCLVPDMPNKLSKDCE